ncbi:MAG: ATP-binding cassette domain-containing protein [Planctomycetes bacterium]|nr:ATP-binding cassette domain-containing protein [Planctomycetota bacterium]
MIDRPAPVLETRGLVVRFNGRPVLRGIDLQARAGEVLFLMGPSGCGKTTVIKCIAALLQPDEGQVLFEGRRLEGVGGGPAVDAMRRATGLVFQGSALLNSISLAENVALPLRARLRLPPAAVREVVRMKLAQVGLLHAMDLRPSELSGGMRKRAGIARALVLDPRLLLLDEPTSGLDPVTSDGIDRLVAQLRHELGVTVVVVSHDLASAERVADRLVILGQGEALVEGTWAEVQASRDPAVRSFLDRRARPPAAAAHAAWEGP